MARTIESPGVEIREVDLSLRTDIPVGTKVLVQGFAAQGNTYELVQVSTKDELDQIYFGGAGPTNAAERYFYHSCREVLNSPATLYVTRFPYGSGDGTGFNGDYVALAYPSTSAVMTSAYEASRLDSVAMPLNGYYLSGTLTYDNVVTETFVLTGVGTTNGAVYVIDVGDGALSGNVANAVITGQVDLTAGTFYMSSVSAFGSGTFAVYYDSSETVDVEVPFISAERLVIGEPVVVPISESDYMDIQAGIINWSSTGGGVISSSDTLGNAAFIVVNDAKTTVNEYYEGYYLALADNEIVIADGYTSIQSVNTLSSSTGMRTIDESLLGFYLTGSDVPVVTNPGSISEKVETCFSYDFTQAEYDNALILYLFRLRKSPYASDPNKLYYAPVENFIGKLDAEAEQTNSVTGQPDSFYLAEKVNNGSNYLKMYVNTNISKYDKITDTEVASNTLNPIGSYTPCRSTDESYKYIGDVPSKIEKALMLAENKQLVDIDLVLDAGVSTIWTYASESVDGAAGGIAPFDDETNVGTEILDLADADTGMESTFAEAHRTVYNLYNNFCSETRKDCLHISDPLRGIFVMGADQKVLSRKDRNFSEHVYTPLKNLYATANSSYACTYANWVQIYDSNSGKYVWMPFSGWEAAIMARMDANFQPWYAPFGLNNGIVRNIVDIAVKTNQKQQDQLYRIGNNPVVFFNGDGFVVWGQKTLQTKPSAFDRINVRRLFLVLERATLRIMRYFVGEPNTVFTRARVNNVLKPIFELAKNNEGVYDYMIVCDERNNTPTVIDANEMKVDIYLKPVRTAEFILVTFYATRTDQDFNELVG